MKKKSLTVNQYMTHLPVECEQIQTVADAESLMADHHVRHLPVMSGLRIQGIVTRSGLLQKRLEHGEALDAMLLEDVCEKDVLTVSPVAKVSEVVEQMLARRVGSAVVVDGEYVVGVFTTTDSLKLLRELLT